MHACLRKKRVGENYSVISQGGKEACLRDRGGACERGGHRLPETGEALQIKT